MSRSVRKKPARTSRKTATTKAARGCGSVTFHPVRGQDNIKPSKATMKRLEKVMLSFFVENIIGKSIKSTGPSSPSGCAKNISNAAEIGLGRRPRNLWPRSERFVEYGFYLDRLYWIVGERVPVVHEKIALPFVIADSRLFEDDYANGDVSL